MKQVKEYKKRTTGKHKINYGMYDIYKYYRTKSQDPVDKIKFRAIINILNLKIRDRILNESEHFKMPFNMGILRIRKDDVSYVYQTLLEKGKNKCPINYKLTKELGHVVYFVESPYRYRWKWVKWKAVLKWKSVYMFEPCRAARRLLAKAILVDKKDYFFEQ